MIKKRFCGHPFIEFKQLLFPFNNNNVFKWFNLKNNFYIHKARTGIYYLCELLNMEKDSEILVPAYNCGSEIDPFVKYGVKVIPYKINTSCEIDLNDLINRITKKTRIIYITHYFGFAHELQKIKQICEENELFLIEDCALSLFSTYNNDKIGNMGDASIFSFPKTLPVPDGGLLQINNTSIIKNEWFRSLPDGKIIFRALLPILKAYILNLVSYFYNIKNKKIKSYGVDNNKKNNNIKKGIPENYYHNLNLNNLNISRISKYLLKCFNSNKIIKKRRDNFSKLLEILKNNSSIRLLFNKLPDNICPLYFPVIVDKRDEINNKLNNSGIMTRCWWAGFYPDINWEDYPEACFLKDHIITLPIHQNLTKKQIKYIGEKVIKLTQ